MEIPNNRQRRALRRGSVSKVDAIFGEMDPQHEIDSQHHHHHYSASYDCQSNTNFNAFQNHLNNGHGNRINECHRPNEQHYEPDHHSRHQYHASHHSGHRRYRHHSSNYHDPTFDHPHPPKINKKISNLQGFDIHQNSGACQVVNSIHGKNLSFTNY